MARPVHLTTGRDDQRLASPLSPRFRLTTPSRETFETATTGKSDQAILSQRELSSNPNEQAKESYLDAKWRIQRLWHSFLARPLFVFVAITSIALLALTITLAVYLPAQKRRREQQYSGGGSTSTPAMSNSTISISSVAPAASTFPPILVAFVSFAIEFAFFPDFAGNNTSPNTFSDNLLNNIGNISGTKPYIRIGGNTQDYALYDSSQETAVVGVYDYAATQNYPTTVHVGPSFFESYNAWPNTKFTHGFNLGRANTPAGWQSLLDTVPLACAALQNDNLLWWEYGNEPDLYDGGQPVQLRTDPWNYSLYIDQWKNGTAAIKVALDAACPTLDTDATYGYVGPSYAYRGFSPQATFANGLNENGTIKLISMHHYMGDTRTPGVSLQGTLMNHTNVALSLSSQLQQELITLSNASLVDPKSPTTQISLIVNEANSLTSNTFGPKGILGTFGNALWTLDYMLFAATLGISRIHMQQGTDFRYGSWQPITTANLTKQTMAPYYGNIAVATMLGNITEATPQIVNLEMGSDYEAAYTAYTNGNLVRATILNLQEYNTTALSGHITPGARPNNTYTLDLGLADGTKITIQRLLADGSDARRGITFDGWSYEFDLDEGRPVRLNNITVGETVTVVDGSFQVSVPASSAVILNF